MSGMEAAVKFRALPLSSGWGKAKPLIVMVVNGSPLANYQARCNTQKMHDHRSGWLDMTVEDRPQQPLITIPNTPQTQS